MKHHAKIGRDIIVGKGWGAKHWSGPVVFGRDAIYICPNASQAALIQGWDSGAAAAGMLGAIGGGLAGVFPKQGEAQPTLPSPRGGLIGPPPDVVHRPQLARPQNQS